MQFIDEATIYISSGDGGNGSVSFRREKYIAFGGPDGGCGGKGGDVIFKTNKHLNSLIKFKFQKHFIANNGKSGMGRNKSGKSGEDLIIEVPVGTQIFDVTYDDNENINQTNNTQQYYPKNPSENSSENSYENYYKNYPKNYEKNLDKYHLDFDYDQMEKEILEKQEQNQAQIESQAQTQSQKQEEGFDEIKNDPEDDINHNLNYHSNNTTNKILIRDLSKNNDEYRILIGGRGGAGNASFKSSTNRSPKIYQKGVKGEFKYIKLELKLLSNIGLVGMPNAGKSSFIRKTTNSKSKIASYPFSTIKPSLGVCIIDDTELVLADIPGLIKNAHKGMGLGDRFLKHIERCQILLHIIDITNEDIIKDYQIINNELNSYSEKLLVKPRVIMLNKTDLLSMDIVNNKIQSIKDYFLQNNINYKIYATSTENKKELSLILKELLKMYNNLN